MSLKYDNSIKYKHKSGTSLSTSVLFTLSAFENIKLKSEYEEESMNVRCKDSIK